MQIRGRLRSPIRTQPGRRAGGPNTRPTALQFNEVLRALDSLRLTARHSVATPVNWRPGEDVIIPTSVSDDAARAKYPAGWKTLKPYLRIVAQPK